MKKYSKMREGLLEKIYQASNDGLNIILSYYPQANESINSNKLFKIRGTEKTPSASLKKIKNVWRVTDFGDEGTAMSPIDICMREENLTFTEALFRLADNYQVSDTLKPEINKPDIKQQAAKKDEKEGDFNFELNEKFTEQELRILGQVVKQKTCDKYSYYSVKWYSKTKDRKTTIISSNENYPIFMRDCGTFKKIYQPLNVNKAYRFFYVGDKPKDYINGLDELRKAHKKFVNDQLPDSIEESENEKKKLKDKLPEAVFCCGERDALNVAGHGYFPLWLNSESARLDQKHFDEISRMVEKIYNIPDLDDTGIRKGNEFAMNYIDIYTVQLPEWISTYKDNRGKPRKDLRDFVELRPKHKDFRDLLRMAKSCRFWDKKLTKEGYKYEINTVNLIHFLKTNGFYTQVDEETKKITYIQVQGYKVTEVVGKQIRGFIKKFLDEKNIDLEIQNLILNSKRTGISVMDDLPEADLDFTNSSHESQTLFFENKAVQIYANEIKEIRNAEIKNYVWDKDICKHNYKKLDRSFIAKFDPETDNIDLEIKNKDSHYFRYLINASRIFWREEFEHRATESSKENEDYLNEYKFAIDGSRLKEKELIEQKQNLLNKLFTIGYLMHTYKFSSKALGIWIMENKLTEESESSGGSGKSFSIEFLDNIKNIVTLDGRHKKLTDNQHIFERVTEFTNIIKIDDAHQYFDFDFFYSLITGNMTVNAKHTKSKELKFRKSPKLVVTSNFPPPKNDASTMRRLLVMVFSDYYHKATGENDYLEDHFISHDFGYDLHNELYLPDYWNQDYNFLIDCLQFYLQVVPHNFIIQAPMENVNRRINIAKMGQQFSEWAAVYFSEESTNVDRLVRKKDVMDDFIRSTNLKAWSTARFTKALKAFVDNTEHIECLNPDQLCSKSDRKRIIRKIEGTTEEMLYLKTVWVDEVRDTEEIFGSSE